MILTGETLSIADEVIEVRIQAGNPLSGAVEIGDGDGGVLFDDVSPVTIDASVNDSFDVMLCHSSTVRLLTDRFLPDLYRETWKDAPAVIRRGGEVVFAGYLMPRVYSQDFVSTCDRLDLNLMDALSALQYVPYRETGLYANVYSGMKRQASTRTFSAIITEILGICSAPLSAMTGGVAPRILYDGSRSVPGGEAPGVFDALEVSDLPFFGDDEESVMTCAEVLESLLRFLGLHICQRGGDFLIWSAATQERGEGVEWIDLTTGGRIRESGGTVPLTAGNAADTDTGISLAEIYSVISVTCPMHTVDSIISSPLEGDDLTSPYTNRQLYVTEMSAAGTGEEAALAMADMYAGVPTDFQEARMTAWFVRVMDHPDWTFTLHAGTEGGGFDLLEYYCRDNADQQKLLQEMHSIRAACVLQTGSADLNIKSTDNALTSMPTLSTCLAISVNGTGREANDTEAMASVIGDRFLRDAPMAIYTGPSTGAVFSPADDDTVNYLVISGKLTLIPVLDNRLSYHALDTIWHEKGGV